MAELLFFHHALGLTIGVQALASTIRQAGHTVHVPDLYDGRTFSTIPDGVAYAQSVGFDNIIARGVAEVDCLPSDLVYAGISLGVLPAQKLSQMRLGAVGAILLEACVPPDMFGAPWPNTVPVQIHGMDNDPSFAGEGDLDAARELVANTPKAELFVYPGDRHLFCDSSLPSYDEAATALLTERILAFLETVG